MKKIINVLQAVAALLCCPACDKDVVKPIPEEPVEIDRVTELYGWPIENLDGDVQHFVAPEPPFEYSVEYRYDASDFCNPERGAYDFFEYHFKDGSIPEPRSVESLSAARKMNITLHYVGVYLCDFLESDISEAALNVLRQHFENERLAGTKVVLRHAYSWSDKWPVQDPELKWVLRHIEQLAPIWHEYQDVIYVVQAGLVGIYGEWHTSTNLNSPDDRAAVVKALLDNVPVSRQVALRTPGQKRSILAKISESGYKWGDSLSVETAFDGSYNARLAGHDDCVLASGSDGGTFSNDYDKRLWERDGNYMSIGGETCPMEGIYEYCGCENSNIHLRRFHFSYLRNYAWQAPEVWREEGCHDDLVSRVGYRLVFNGASFYGHFRAGGSLTMKMCLSNYGFASIINERRIELVLVNENDASEKYVFVSGKDPRDWKGCHHYEWDEKIVLPDSLKPGEQYTLYLNLPDISPALHDNPDFSVRVASKGVWDEKTGYNRIASFIADM
ncbi:MAG: DUF4874 domain-containing protein [Bacteroidales bacterium]|nr:DUF4874 domain-containing protein [Bacteroidales bacterium]